MRSGHRADQALGVGRTGTRLSRSASRPSLIRSRPLTCTFRSSGGGTRTHNLRINSPMRGIVALLVTASDLHVRGICYDRLRSFTLQLGHDRDTTSVVCRNPRETTKHYSRSKVWWWVSEAEPSEASGHPQWTDPQSQWTRIEVLNFSSESRRWVRRRLVDMSSGGEQGKQGPLDTERAPGISACPVGRSDLFGEDPDVPDDGVGIGVAFVA